MKKSSSFGDLDHFHEEVMGGVARTRAAFFKALESQCQSLPMARVATGSFKPPVFARCMRLGKIDFFYHGNSLFVEDESASGGFLMNENPILVRELPDEELLLIMTSRWFVEWLRGLHTVTEEARR